MGLGDGHSFSMSMSLTSLPRRHTPLSAWLAQPQGAGGAGRPSSGAAPGRLELHVRVLRARASGVKPLQHYSASSARAGAGARAAPGARARTSCR